MAIQGCCTLVRGTIPTPVTHAFVVMAGAGRVETEHIEDNATAGTLLWAAFLRRRWSRGWRLPRSMNRTWEGERVSVPTEDCMAIGGTHDGTVGRLQAAHLGEVSTP